MGALLKRSYNGSSKAVAASGITTFTQADLPTTGLVDIGFVCEPAGNIFSDLDRLRIKAGGATIVDVTNAQLAAYLEALTPANYANLAARQSFTFPFWDMLGRQQGLSMADAMTQQFPYGQPPQIELIWGAGAVPGTVLMTYGLAMVRPRTYMRLLSSAHGQPVGGTNNRFPFTDPGNFRGFSIATAGLRRARCVVNGEEVYNLPGVLWIAAGGGDPILETQRHTGNLVTTTDPVWLFPDTGEPAQPGVSYIEFDQTGAAANGEICILGQSPQG